MSGHSKWHQIKHKKGETDKKRGALFSKLLRAIAVVARDEANPDLSPRLRAVIEKAKSFNVPADNIERILKKTTDTANLEDIFVEAYGPEGSALIIHCITDNRNRTMQGVRQILKDFEARAGEPGSARWAFDPPGKDETLWKPKFLQDLSDEGTLKLKALLAELQEHSDVITVTTNTAVRAEE